MVNEDRPEEALTYGSTPYYTGFPFPPLLMTSPNLKIEDFTRVCRGFYDWLTFNPQWRLFFPTLLDSWPHGDKFVRTRFEALRLLTKAQFFMRHPTHEGPSRGEWSSTKIDAVFRFCFCFFFFFFMLFCFFFLFLFLNLHFFSSFLRTGYLRNIWAFLDGIIDFIDNLPENYEEEDTSGLRFTFDFPRDDHRQPPPPPPPPPPSAPYNSNRDRYHFELLPCV
jgi:hypothetical protein